MQAVARQKHRQSPRLPASLGTEGLAKGYREDKNKREREVMLTAWRQEAAPLCFLLSAQQFPERQTLEALAWEGVLLLMIQCPEGERRESRRVDVYIVAR